MTRAARAMAMFGIDSASASEEHARLHSACIGGATGLDRLLTPGEVALVAGPSGAGKSTLLRALAELLQRNGRTVAWVEPEAPSDAPIVDRVGASAEEAIALLARAGLGEARLLGQPAHALSDGQRARFRIALAMNRALRVPAPATLLVDEFGAQLDEVTARSLANSFGRWVRAERMRAVVASVREDEARALSPEVCARVGLDGAIRLGRRTGGTNVPPESASAVRIEVGTIEDYGALARDHYAAGRPGPIVRVLRAVDVGSGELAGALVVSMPALNGRWRRLAWPGRFEDVDRRARARRINAELRVLSRVIVDPRFRACGVGTALVRAYLADPLTPLTEAVAAMGAACPLFERAGMTPIRMAQRPMDGRLERALLAMDIEPERLADPGGARAIWRDEALRQELRIWANASRRTRRLLEAPPQQLMRQAARALLAEPVAYVTDPTCPPQGNQIERAV